MNTRKAGLLAFVTVAMLATIAYAGDNDGRPGPGRHGGGPGFGIPDPGMMIGRMAEHLDLDDVQRESVKNIMEAAKPELEALREAEAGVDLPTSCPGRGRVAVVTQNLGQRYVGAGLP